MNNNQYVMESKNKEDQRRSTVALINTKNLPFPCPGSCNNKKQTADKTFKILHSPQNIDSKVLNYVRNVPAQISSQEYAPSSIQGNKKIVLSRKL